jgi:1-acyl-sn-glycerol-3-phosphate acyltransferase
MGIRSTVVNAGIGLLFRLFCTIEDKDLRKLPLRGPAILISNHTSNLEGPLFYVRLRPRNTIAMAKAELWSFFATRMIMEAWDAIPIRRGRLDRGALRKCARVLERGDFLCIAPEGKRSKDGALLRGQAGATWFAADKPIPIYPMVQWGCRDILGDLMHLRRPRITIKVGRPFLVRTPAAGTETSVHHDSDVRQAMADEMMYQIAENVPERYRGYYADFSKKTTHYLQFV